MSYRVEHDPTHNSYVILFKKQQVATVDSELVKPAGIFRKPVYHWHVSNIPGASRTPFINHKLAIDHAIDLHKKILSGNFKDHNHPLKRTSALLDELGQVIWDSSRDPRFSDLDTQEKMQDLKISHAHLVRIFNKHFGE